MRKDIERKEKKAVESVPERQKQRMKELKGKRSSLLESMRDLRSNIDTLRTRIELWEKSLGEMGVTQQNAEKNIEGQKEIIAKAIKDIEHLAKEVEKRESVEAKLSEKLKEYRTEYQDRKKDVWDNDRELERLVDDIESKTSYIGMQENALSLTRQELGEVMVNISQYEIEVEAPYPAQEELKVNIKRLEERMERLEPVNMVALEVYDREKERKDGIVDKHEKLKEEMRSLSRMMNDVRKKKKDKFMEVFAEVDGNFREMYPQICTNGEGYLHLENKEEPFDGGLIIRARPPGKKMRDIRYLSGGEKSQVAIAFILALQRYDPSPFYVLDEVDQNLDRVNSGIIAAMIKKYSSSAQFIMISLHRDIMHYAHHLYGCYIKDGISKMVAIQNIQEIPFTEGEDGKIIAHGRGGDDKGTNPDKDTEVDTASTEDADNDTDTEGTSEALVKVEEDALARR